MVECKIYSSIPQVDFHALMLKNLELKTLGEFLCVAIIWLIYSVLQTVLFVLLW